MLVLQADNPGGMSLRDDTELLARSRGLARSRFVYRWLASFAVGTVALTLVVLSASSQATRPWLVDRAPESAGEASIDVRTAVSPAGPQRSRAVVAQGIESSDPSEDHMADVAGRLRRAPKAIQDVGESDKRELPSDVPANPLPEAKHPSDRQPTVEAEPGGVSSGDSEAELGGVSSGDSEAELGGVSSDDTEGLRLRRPVSREQFDTFVRARKFDDVSTVAPGVVHGRYRSGDQRIDVLLVHQSEGARIGVSPVGRGKAPVGGWASEVGAVAAVNGNWFDPFDGPAVSSGVVYGGTDHGYTALFGFTADGHLVTDHHRAVKAAVDARVQEAIAGHPTLILDRVVTTDFGGDPTFTRRHPRTAIGVTGSIDVVLLVAVEGRSGNAAGMTGLETARLMERLGAHHAVMLDGGGSTAMWIAGRGVVTNASDPGRPVGNQVAVFVP